MPKHEKIHDKNAIDKSTILHSSNIFNPILNLILVLCLEHISVRSLPNSYHFLEQQGKEKNIQIYLKRETLIAI
jgi:hypothetical protein